MQFCRQTCFPLLLQSGRPFNSQLYNSIRQRIIIIALQQQFLMPRSISHLIHSPQLLRRWQLIIHLTVIILPRSMVEENLSISLLPSQAILRHLLLPLYLHQQLLQLKRKQLESLALRICNDSFNNQNRLKTTQVFL